MSVAVHPGFDVSVPPIELPSAATFVNCTPPKLESESCRQRNWLQDEGASATHSAEERSAFGNGRVVVNVFLRVRFLTWSITLAPSSTTFTDVVITSPGATSKL